MTCPMYKDYTRECVENYNRVLQVSSFDICETDKYNECPMYNIIMRKVECCEYTPECDKEMNFGIWDFEHLKYIATNFCFRGKKGNCAIFQLRNAGIEVPKGLQPDGKIVEVKN